MVNVAEEVQDPRHTLPSAITITLVVATLLYIAVATAVLVALPVDRLAGADAPLMLMFETAPTSIQTGFAAVAVVATVNGVLIQIVMASRVLYGMAKRGQLPIALTRISPGTRTPSVATALVTAIILGLSSFFPIAELAGGTSQIVLAVFIFVNLSLIGLKRQGTPPKDIFTVPMAVPVLGVITSIGLLATSFL